MRPFPVLLTGLVRHIVITLVYCIVRMLELVVGEGYNLLICDCGNDLPVYGND